MEKLKIGRIVPLIKGEYSSSVSYVKMDIVTYEGSAYWCIKDCSGIVPTNDTYWKLLVSKGNNGDKMAYSDLTAAEKADLAQGATAAAQQAAQHLATIQNALDGLDPSQSTEAAITTLTAQLADTQADVDELGPKVNKAALCETPIGSTSDLDVGDESGNVLMRLKDGHVKTKNFDSSQDATTEQRGLMSAADKSKLDGITDGIKSVYGYSDSDVDFGDENGNVLLKLKRGHIQTKYFDSSEIDFDDETMESKLSMSNFSGWTIADGVASTTSTGVQLKYNTITYEDVFDLSFAFSCTGSFELAFGKNDTTLAGTMFSIGSDSKVRVYLNNSTLKATYNLSNVVISAGKPYHVALKRRVTASTIFEVIVTDANGNEDTIPIVTSSSLFVGCSWGQFAFELKSGASASITELSVNYIDKPQLMIVGHSFVEGMSIPDDRNKRYAFLIEKSLGKVFISGQGGASTSTFSGGTFLAEASFFPDVKYVLFNLGTNDSNDSTIITGLTTLKSQAESLDIIPIFATVSPDLRNGTTKLHTDANNWIKQQDYYVDTAAAFFNADGTINTGAYLTDNVHPTIATHQKMANIFLAKYKNLFNYKK